jgi:hypothetical protein
MPERPFDEKIQLKKTYRKKRFDPCGKAIGKPIEILPKSDQTEYPVKCTKWLQVTPSPNTLLFGEGPKALTWIKGVFHWPKANLEWKTPRYWSRCDQ